MGKSKHYLILDTETATMPWADKLAKGDAIKKRKVAISKPLVYDIAWVIMNTKGNIIKERSFITNETFFVPSIFSTAYYRDRRPLYLERLKKGEAIAAPWLEIMDSLEEDLKSVNLAGAYNAPFDFKKAIPFTTEYIQHLYFDPNYAEWEDKQLRSAKQILKAKSKDGNKPSNPEYLAPYYKTNPDLYPIVDIWGLACQRLLNNHNYKRYCLQHGLLTESAQYFKTSAETAFQYLAKDYDFQEAHTAIDDARIEAFVLAKALKKGKVEPGLEAFPFRELGDTVKYVTDERPKYKPIVKEKIGEYLANKGSISKDYYNRMMKIYEKL